MFTILGCNIRVKLSNISTNRNTPYLVCRVALHIVQCNLVLSNLPRTLLLRPSPSSSPWTFLERCHGLMKCNVPANCPSGFKAIFIGSLVFLHGWICCFLSALSKLFVAWQEQSIVSLFHHARLGSCPAFVIVWAAQCFHTFTDWARKGESAKSASVSIPHYPVDRATNTSYLRTHRYSWISNC